MLFSEKVLADEEIRPSATFTDKAKKYIENILKNKKNSLKETDAGFIYEIDALFHIYVNYRVDNFLICLELKDNIHLSRQW